jgi:hypothetical protein
MKVDFLKSGIHFLIFNGRIAVIRNFVFFKIEWENILIVSSIENLNIEGLLRIIFF